MKKYAALCAVIVSLVLIGIKSIAWHLSHSVSLLSSLVDSVVDSLASAINLIAIHHATKPADKEHRFGHGKIEALSALGQSLFIAFSGIFVFWEASQKLIQPHPIENSKFVIIATLISILLTLGLVFFQRYVINRTDSVAIKADYIHYKSDLLINLGILLIVSLESHLQLTFLDPVFGAAIAFYIMIASYKIAKKSLGILMDRELSSADQKRIKTIILEHPKVSGYHLLRTRSSGTGEFIQCHLEMDGHMTLLEAHDIADEVERAILKHYPSADVILHQDPAHIMEAHREGL